MHVRAIDTPSDIYGSVTSVSRPLVHAMNQATMQQSTYDALHSLLVWALAVMEADVPEALEAHKANEHAAIRNKATPEEIRASESTQDAQTDVPLSKGMPEQPELVVEAPKAADDKVLPISSEMLPDSPEDVAAEAEIGAHLSAEAAAEASTVQEAPAVVTKRIAKPQ